MLKVRVCLGLVCGVTPNPETLRGRLGEMDRNAGSSYKNIKNEFQKVDLKM